MILAGDIGGTKTDLALLVQSDSGLRVEGLRSFESQRYPDLETIVEAYVSGAHVAVVGACFGVAGPVIGGAAHITNLPWHLSEESLRQVLGTAHVRLINDLEALAYAIPLLSSADLVPLQEGAPEPGGAKAILAPGTGLGVGYLHWDGECYRPGASEGGHGDFAPANALQVRLLEFLQAEYGHVSWERVLSGPGLHNIYRFLATRGEPEPAWVTEKLAAGDVSAAISALALDGTHMPCVHALDILVSIMGAQAGNLALTFVATGGLYLGGGIPPKLLPRLQRDATFLQAFRGKGRLTGLMELIPVHVISSSRASLLGAGSCALTMLA